MQKLMRIVRLALADILLAGLIVLCFAYFHHVRPLVKAPRQETAAIKTESVPEGEVQTAEPAEKTAAEAVDKTEWQIKFADKFSDTIETTANSYKSPNVSIEIETFESGKGDDKITYHVADIYIASLDNFVTYTANNEVVYFGKQDALEMSEASSAIIAMTGDFLTYQQTGLLVRNGNVYKQDDVSCDICVMYPDGRVETLKHGEYDVQELLKEQPYQIWNFGPALLDKDGTVRESFGIAGHIRFSNPRSGLGYYEPGHYCFAVVDGRKPGHSKGMLLSEFAQIFEDLGCQAAYNLDGGGSALMIFNNEHYSSMSNGGNRELGDIVLIRESEGAQ